MSTEVERNPVRDHQAGEDGCRACGAPVGEKHRVGCDADLAQIGRDEGAPDYASDDEGLGFLGAVNAFEEAVATESYDEAEYYRDKIFGWAGKLVDAYGRLADAACPSRSVFPCPSCGDSMLEGETVCSECATPSYQHERRARLVEEIWRDNADRRPDVYELVAIPEDWEPSSEAINRLPDPLRDWVHDLETRVDPAGDLRARRMAEDRVRELGELARPSDMVREFHREVVGNLDDRRSVDDSRYGLLRVRLIQEETREFTEALSTGDRVGVADALADLLYVTYGAAVMYGIPIEAVFAEVHRANMEKGGDRDEGGKVEKPDDFAEPDIAGVLDSR